MVSSSVIMSQMSDFNLYAWFGFESHLDFLETKSVCAGMNFLICS